MKIVLIALICLYIAFNIAVAVKMNPKEMYRRFVKGQNVVGRIASNLFYAPAWVLKAIKFLANKTIK